MRVLAALLILIPSVARADAISPLEPCPAGESRVEGRGSGIGSVGHVAPPGCQPALCDSVEGMTCPESRVCRRDAHCIEMRMVRERRRARSHEDRYDPDDPASYHEVERTFDLGACDAGACPGPARCVAVATCRPRDELDRALVANAGRATTAARAWAYGVPYDPSIPLGPVVAAPVETPEPTSAPPTTRAPTAPATDHAPPAAPSAGFCHASARREARLPIVLSMLWLAALSVRSRRRWVAALRSVIPS